jgi:hypothetical protein
MPISKEIKEAFQMANLKEAFNFLPTDGSLINNNDYMEKARAKKHGTVFHKHLKCLVEKGFAREVSVRVEGRWNVFYGRILPISQIFIWGPLPGKFVQSINLEWLKNSPGALLNHILPLKKEEQDPFHRYLDWYMVDCPFKKIEKPTHEAYISALGHSPPKELPKFSRDELKKIKKIEKDSPLHFCGIRMRLAEEHFKKKEEFLKFCLNFWKKLYHCADTTTPENKRDIMGGYIKSKNELIGLYLRIYSEFYEEHLRPIDRDPWKLLIALRNLI